MCKPLLLLVSLLLVFSVNGQVPKSVTVDQRYGNLTFSQFAKNLFEQDSVRIFYQEKWVENITTPTVTQKVLLSDFLQTVLSKSDLHYIDFQGNIVVMPGRQQVAQRAITHNTVIVGNPLDKGKYRTAVISGQVFEGKTKNPIPGAQIICEALSKGTSTNFDGKFTLELPTGQHKMKFSFMGLDDELRDVFVYSDGSMEVDLYEKSISLNQINIFADRPEDNFRSTSMGMVKLSSKSIKKLSVLMGEPDIIKSMVLLPGVQSAGENSSGFNVRGGNTDQNLILIHDAPVYNTAHMFGLFSMLDPGVVDNVTLYKSGIPSKFGGRLSSVMDIDVRKGQLDKFKVNGGIGLINSRLSVEGPIYKNKISFMAGGRATYSDWMLGLLKNYQLQQSSVSFYDFNAKIDYEINSNNRVSLFGYGSHDYFNYFEEAEYGYGNVIGSARWNHIFDKFTSATLSLNFSKYTADLVDYTSKNYEYDLSTSIEQEQVSYHFSTSRFARHRISAGMNVIRYLIEPGNSAPHSPLSAAAFINVDDENGYEAALYLEDEFDLTPELALIAGLRYSGFAKIGQAQVKTYYPGQPLNESTVSGTNEFGAGQVVKFHHGAEPRIALRYELPQSSSLKLGYNRTMQYIRQISNSTSITPADYWKSSDTYLKPLIANQLALGYFKNFKNNKYETSLELYYKNIENEVDYKNGGRLVLNRNLEQVLISGIGRAYGLELMVKKSSGDLTGWVAYTYSRSFKKMNGTFDEEKVNGGKWYRSNIDKPHDLTMVMNYKLSRRFTFSSNFTYSTGRPVTLPEQKYNVGSYEIVYYSERNKYRMPDYHRLDLALTYEGSLLKKQKWRSSWTISVYNVYGRKNPFSVYYSKEKPTRQNNYNVYALYSFSVIGVPIPSFTYNFWF
ncbi:MAG TPA: TonB-dependent receptor [Prolixibacteraceae bacterium]|nr:TonB-dependent receptor [Prolixibacteraceae bacterium]